jgi:hypothetical protein
MIGALQAGWEYVEGVELTEEYIPIAEAANLGLNTGRPFWTIMSCLRRVSTTNQAITPRKDLSPRISSSYAITLPT